MNSEKLMHKKKPKCAHGKLKNPVGKRICRKRTHGRKRNKCPKGCR